MGPRISNTSLKARTLTVTWISKSQRVTLNTGRAAVGQKSLNFLNCILNCIRRTRLVVVQRMN